MQDTVNDALRGKLIQQISERGLKAIENESGMELTADEVRALFHPETFIVTEESESSQGANSAMRLGLTWLIRAHMDDVLRIENSSFDTPWTEQDFLECLRQNNCIGMVAMSLDSKCKVVGFMIYELHKSRLHLLKMVVDPDVRRNGVGSQMVSRLIDKLSQQRRNEIRIEVSERNLNAQLFLKSQGFKACPAGEHIEFRFTTPGK